MKCSRENILPSKSVFSIRLFLFSPYISFNFVPGHQFRGTKPIKKKTTEVLLLLRAIKSMLGYNLGSGVLSRVIEQILGKNGTS